MDDNELLFGKSTEPQNKENSVANANRTADSSIAFFCAMIAGLAILFLLCLLAIGYLSGMSDDTQQRADTETTPTPSVTAKPHTPPVESKKTVASEPKPCVCSCPACPTMPEQHEQHEQQKKEISPTETPAPEIVTHKPQEQKPSQPEKNAQSSYTKKQERTEKYAYTPPQKTESERKQQHVPTAKPADTPSPPSLNTSGCEALLQRGVVGSNEAGLMFISTGKIKMKNCDMVPGMQISSKEKVVLIDPDKKVVQTSQRILNIID